MLPAKLIRRIKRRRKRPVWKRPPLTDGQIVAWAGEHHRRTGLWPNVNTGRVRGALEEDWKNLDNCLRAAFRGAYRWPSCLPSTAACAARGIFRRSTWPKSCAGPTPIFASTAAGRATGPIDGVRGETWSGVDWASTSARGACPAARPCPGRSTAIESGETAPRHAACARRLSAHSRSRRPAVRGNAPIALTDGQDLFHHVFSDGRQ